jgi:hypothetical protein
MLGDNNRRSPNWEFGGGAMGVRGSAQARQGSGQGSQGSAQARQGSGQGSQGSAQASQEYELVLSTLYFFRRTMRCKKKIVTSELRKAPQGHGYFFSTQYCQFPEVH